MDFDFTTETLYAVLCNRDDPRSAFGTINTTTGAFSPIADVGGRLMEIAISARESSVLIPYFDSTPRPVGDGSSRGQPGHSGHDGHGRGLRWQRDLAGDDDPDHSGPWPGRLRCGGDVWGGERVAEDHRGSPLAALEVFTNLQSGAITGLPGVH